VTALILTYHAVEEGPAPLCFPPKAFRAHLDAIAEAEAEVLTVAEMAAALHDGDLPDRAVAITFDDGFRSIIEHAAPMLHARSLPATVFAVSGHLGGENDWPTQPKRAPRRPLATAEELSELVGEGWEIGCHGLSHAPLAGATPGTLDRELIDARRQLAEATGADVRSFAFPYGAVPGDGARDILAHHYAAAVTTELGPVRPDSDVLALPRIETHYIRRGDLLLRSIEGTLDTYLGARRRLAKVRRVLRRDYVADGKSS
jgi:peptidoglycan/xylan/chitin deacetylase (PgdA/CDA1 family)